ATDWIGRMQAALRDGAGVRALGDAPRGADPQDWVGRMAAARSGELRPGSVLEVERVQSALIQACSDRDLSAVLALFTPDATVRSGGRTYTGILQIRDYWAQTAAFRSGSPWVGYAAPVSVRIETDPDRASVMFDWVWVNPETSRVAGLSRSEGVLVRVGRTWMIEDLSSEGMG
ncbi:MAG TPA: nuclear transport factor 2 family protein, partial [Spirochaetia bacterium]|nr:nuclear transport factor 2 family protein [Spirochaetia bacterium]